MITDVELRAVLCLAQQCMYYEYVDGALQLDKASSPDVQSVGAVLVRLVAEYRTGRDKRS